MNYQIGDFIIRIKNAALARRKVVELPYSKLNKSVGEVLVAEKYLQEIKEEIVDGKQVLIGTIRYVRRTPALTDIAILSKPSLRRYGSAKETFGRERNKMSTIVLSTNKGVMTGKQARKENIGGEFLFEIW